MTRVHVGMGIDDNLGNAAMGSLETALAYAPGYETFFVGGQVGIGWDGFDGTVRWNAGATVGVFMGSITLGYVGDVTAEGTRHGAFASAQLGLHFIGFYARYHVFVEAPNSAEVGLYIGFPLRVEGDGAPRVEW